MCFIKDKPLWTKEYVEKLFIRRNTRDKRQIKSGIIYFITCTILGVGIGLITNRVLFTKQNSNFWFSAIFFIWLAGILFIIIHEAGHLVGGIITSYRFQSFRIFSYCIIKKDKEYVIEKRYVPGSSGQCLMIPPSNWSLDSPCLIYHAGGGIATFLAAIFSGLLYFFVSTSLLEIMWFVFFCYGMILTVLNLVPLQLSGTNNDGANILAIIRDKTAKEAFFKQLECNAWFSQGKKLEDISENYLKLSENAIWSEPINYYLEWILYSKYLKERKIDKAEELLMRMEESYQDMLLGKKIRINSERLYLLILRQADTDTIQTFYSNVVERLKSQKLCTPILRTLITYERYIKNNTASLEQYKEVFYRAKKVAACKQEAEVDYILTFEENGEVYEPEKMEE